MILWGALMPVPKFKALQSVVRDISLKTTNVNLVLKEKITRVIWIHYMETTYPLIVIL